jgi:hypothetical protein
MTVTSTPAAMRWTAVVWRNVCGEILFEDIAGIIPSGFNVMTKLKANAGCAEFPPVSITKDWFVRTARLPMQEGSEQICRFGPQGTDSFLAALPATNVWRRSWMRGPVRPLGRGGFTPARRKTRASNLSTVIREYPHWDC